MEAKFSFSIFRASPSIRHAPRWKLWFCAHSGHRRTYTHMNDMDNRNTHTHTGSSRLLQFMHQLPCLHCHVLQSVKAQHPTLVVASIYHSHIICVLLSITADFQVIPSKCKDERLNLDSSAKHVQIKLV